MRYSPILLLLSVLLLGISCSPKGEQSDLDIPFTPSVEFDLNKIIERGKLIAVFDNTSTGYFIYKGQPMGYQYELVKRYCDKIGVSLEIKVITSIDQAFDLINSGEADLIAFFLAITNQRKEVVHFTEPLTTTRQVLVQRKPDNWRKVSTAYWNRQLIRNQVDLIGKTVHVRKSSSYTDRLNHLSEEMGGVIHVIEEDSVETEELINWVVDGKIEYTITDEQLGEVNAAYQPLLDVETPVSFPQRIAWAIRNNNPELESSLNEFINEIQSTSLHAIIYNRYFKVSRQIIDRAQSEFSSITGNQISPYDEIIHQWADSIGWDWRLLSSLIYQESRFKSEIISWAGAEGLMQVMPNTGAHFGANNLLDPSENIKAGCRFLKFLENEWSDKVPEPQERIKFILASYNIGLGHVQDGVALAQEMGLSVTIWDENVAACMVKKSDPKFFRKEIVKYGYARGQSSVEYVNDILLRYQQYIQHFEK